MKHTPMLRVLALVAVIGLVAGACGGDKKSDEAKGDLTAVPGFDPAAKTIHLGVITPLTGPVAAIGIPLTSGTETWFKYINEEKGGIGGQYKVILDKEDSQYSPQLGVQAYNKIKDNEVLIAQLLGTPVTKAVLPQLAAPADVVAAPASLDADWVRQPQLLPVGGPYQTQMINAADYGMRKLDLKNKVVCSLIQDDAYGQAGQQGIEFAAQKYGYTVKPPAKFVATSPTNNPDFTAPIQQLKGNGCQVTFLVSTPTDTNKAFTKANDLQFAPQWIGQSPSYIGSLAKAPIAPYLQKNFLLVSEGTEWGDRSVKGMADMLDRLQKFTPTQQPDPYFVFGYYQAWGVSQILEKAVELGDLSRAGIKKAMAEVGTLKFDGLSGDYKYGPPDKREPPRESTIFRINPAKPTGLEKVEYNFASDAAKEFKFTG